MTFSSAEKILLGVWTAFFVIVGAATVWVVTGCPPEPNVSTPRLADSPAEKGAASPEPLSPSEEAEHTVEDAVETATSAPQDHSIDEAQVAAEDAAPLYEDGPHGPLPVIAEDGRRAWREFAISPSGDIGEDTARIAIVIMGMGLGQSASEEAISGLPKGFTLAFSPYGRNIEDLAARAHSDGHEILLMVPMEPLRYPQNDPGPDVLLRDNTAAQNLNRLHKVMGRLTGYIGLVNDMGSSFTANEGAMRPVLDEVKARGLMFIDARSTNFSVAASLAQRLEVPIAYNNRFIDQNPSREEIMAMLDALEATAQSTGAAVGLARPLPITLSLLQEWAAGLGEKADIELVGISAIANGQPIR